MSRPITVRLIGGLGNQLFGYYAGAALAANLGVALRLDTSWTRHGITDHGIEILKFDLPGDWLSEYSWRARLSAPGTLPGRAMGKALRELPVLGKPFRIYEAPGVGHDTQLLRQPVGTRLRGYFQSWETVQYAVDRGYPRRPSLRQSNRWLDETIRRAREERPIAVHVRRGDYAHVSEFGLLGPGYYEAAINRLHEQGSYGSIWLFSDEPAVARQALGQYADQAESITSPDGPATEMLAMSCSAANVIANSTFSWWAAWMAGPASTVIRPNPWFAHGPEIKGLTPPWWTSLNAGWLAP